MKTLAPHTLIVADLKPADYNPRQITPAALEALGKALREFGDLGGIVVNKRTGNLVGGHQRVKALDPTWKIVKTKRDGVAGTVARGYVITPFGELDYREVDWPEKKEKAANLAANKHGGTFNIAGVKALLSELDDGKFDLDLTGFLADERFSLIGDSRPDIASPDDVPAIPAKAKTTRGTLYILGRHRLLCGDATESADWSRLMNGAKAALVHTDPPYGVSYAGHDKPWEVIAGDHKKDDALLAMLTKALRNAAAATAKTAAFYVWHASSTREEFATALKNAGLMERQYLIWAKPGILIGHADYNWAHEPCFYAFKAGEKVAFYGDRTQSTLWRAALARRDSISTVLGPGLLLRDGAGGELYMLPRAPKSKKIRAVRLEANQSVCIGGGEEANSTIWEIGRESGYKHPTQKPVELARRALSNSSRPGEIVVDCFLGSGTTLIAAELLGRACYGMELDPKYCDVIVSRWEKISGQKAQTSQRFPA